MNIEEEASLVKAAQAGDIEARNELLMQHELWVWKRARKYAINSPVEDVFQAGFLGLLKAIKKFDTSKGFRFLTYADRAVCNNMIEENYYATQLVRIPLWAQSAEDETTKRLASSAGRVSSLEPDDEYSSLFHPATYDEDSLLAGDTTAELNAAIEQLPERFQETIRLRLSGWIDREIAQKLGVSKQRIQQIRKRAVVLLAAYMT